MKMMNNLAIDYSLNSPACCVYNGDLSEYKLYYVCKAPKTKKSKDLKFLTLNHNILNGVYLSDWDIVYERYRNNAKFITHILDSNDVKKVLMEDYAFASKGLVFNIGENGWELKRTLYYDYSLIVEKIAPKTIKKFFTGNGNANKLLMYDTFVEKTGLSLCDIFETDKKDCNPIQDIVDAYALAYYDINNKGTLDR